MGNCCLGGSGGGAGAVHYARTNPVWVEEGVRGRKEEEEEARKGEGAPAATTEVKIRITRKQLEELLRRVEDGKHAAAAGGCAAPVQEVISELLSVVNTSSILRHRAEGQWRPSLHTIPE